MLMLLIVLLLVSCASKNESATVVIDYGSSDIYSKTDMDKAIKLIQEEFNTWDDCELHTLRYAGDNCNSADNIAWMNDLSEAQNLGLTVSQCIEFVSDFHSPVNPKNDTAWEADAEYTDWQWYLAREDGGPWHLLTWGY